MKKAKLLPAQAVQRTSLRKQLNVLYAKQADYVKLHRKASEDIADEIKRVQDALYLVDSASVQRL
jgi:hypothetical protein